jgi:hypothetical protein
MMDMRMTVWGFTVRRNKVDDLLRSEEKVCIARMGTTLQYASTPYQLPAMLN